MAADLTVPFAPSCCEGGVCELNDISASPCGCDKGAGWVCAQHIDKKTEFPYIAAHHLPTDTNVYKVEPVMKQVQVREDAMRDTIPAMGFTATTAVDFTMASGSMGDAPCFIIKDSGKRETYSGGMVRDTTEGKVMYSLIADGPMLKRWAVHLTKGAAKYGTGNWLKAEGDVELRRAKDSAFRHFMQWYYGEVDEDHASAVYFNVNECEYIKDKMKRDA